MIAYQLRMPTADGHVIDFTAMDDGGARSFAVSHCLHADCEVWAGDRLVHQHVGAPPKHAPVTGLAPPKAVG